MVKRRKNAIPNPQQALELLAGQPSQLQQLTNPQDLSKKPTQASVAKLLNCSVSALRKVLTCIKMGNPMRCLNWCRGRPKKKLNLSQTQINWIVSR